MSALFLYVLRPPLHGLYQFSPPPYYLAELKQTKPLLPRFATSLPYRRRLCRSSSKTFPCFQQLYGFLISILGSPLLGQALKANPPQGSPPQGLPPGAPLCIVYYIVSYRIQGRQVGKNFGSSRVQYLQSYSRVGSYAYIGSVRTQYQFVAVRSKGQIRI